MITSLTQLFECACKTGDCRAVVVTRGAEAGLRSAVLIQELGLAKCTVVGDVATFHRLHSTQGIDLSCITLIDAPNPEMAIRQAMHLCRKGQADVLVNDGLEGRVLFSALLDRQYGLRVGALLSGVSVIEFDEPQRLLLLADALMVVSPNLEQRIAIVQNAIDVAHRLEFELPHVALIGAAETVNPKSQFSVDAAQITMMAKRKQIRGAIIDGPLGFDNAISPHAARVKGIDSDVAGKADILITPDIEAGHLLLKTLSALCRIPSANVIVGGKVPLVLWSPEDDVHTRTTAMALGTLCS